MQGLTAPFWLKVIVGVVEYLGPLTPSIMLDSVVQTCDLVSRKWDLFVASSSSVLTSVLMLVVVELCTNTKLPMCESESVDVFPIVAKASLARERSFLYFTRATCDVCFCFSLTKSFCSVLG